MTPTEARRTAALSAPDDSGEFTLYPATFGLLEWLQGKRKNPLLNGGDVELKHALEMAFSFTVPSAELCGIPDSRINSEINDFSHHLTPGEFQRIQKHAEKELLKFQLTSVVPKKAPAVARKKPARK